MFGPTHAGDKPHVATLNDRERIAWIDATKAIGIVLVVFGHTLASGFTFDVIYAFHMPLFFVLSGLMALPFLASSLAVVAWRLARALLVPFAFFGFVTVAFDAALQRVTTGQFQGPAHMLAAAGAVAYGIGEWMPSNWTLWFFPCLFLAVMLSVALVRALGQGIAFALTLAAAVALMTQAPLPMRLPWSADSAVVAAVFVQIGMLGARLRPEVLQARLSGRAKPAAALLACLAVVATAFIAEANGTVDLARFAFGNPMLYLAGAASGMSGVILLALCLPPGAILRRLARDSRVIFPLHTLVFGMMTGIAMRGLGLERAAVRDSAAGVAFYVLAGILLTLLAASLLRYAAPWVIGEKPLLMRPSLS